MRLFNRHLLSVNRKRTFSLAGTSGGITRTELYGAGITFLAAVIRSRRQFILTDTGFQPLRSWIIIPVLSVDVQLYDHIYLPGDYTWYTVTSIDRYPLHIEYTIEDI